MRKIFIFLLYMTNAGQLKKITKITFLKTPKNVRFFINLALFERFFLKLAIFVYKFLLFGEIEHSRCNKKKFKKIIQIILIIIKRENEEKQNII